MKVQNPVLMGFNPDPSMIWVEPYYYIATSTFEYYPGVQIHRSKDLLNWQVVARPINDSNIDMKGITESCGVWAPDLSYCDGVFYLVYSNVTLWTNGPFKDVSNYIICTTDVTGKWSKPKYINSSGFDASLFHDTDGKKYFINMEWDFRNPENDAFTGILCQEIDGNTFELKGEAKKIFLGTDRKLVEGPHIYKRNDYYYLLTAEGGTVLTHAATLARSKNIWGEYELHPYKHLVTSFGYDCNLKKAGHGSICCDSDGKWFLAHLVGRPLVKDKCPLGRETAIQNIQWIDDWAFIDTTQQIPKDYFEIEKVVQKIPQSKQILFDKDSLKLRWQSLRTDISKKYKLKNGSLILKGGASYLNCLDQSLLAYRQQDFVFESSVKVSFEPENFQHLAGMVYRYNEHNQYLLLVTFDKGQKYLSMHSVIDGVVTITNLDNVKGDVVIKLKVDYDKAQYYYLDQQDFKPIGNAMDVSTLTDENANPLGFTGAFVGVYVGDFRYRQKCATFSDFVYSSQSHQ